MRILITNSSLENRAGSELFVRDLSTALMKRGHLPVVYSKVLGDVARELEQATIPVIDDLHALNEPPAVIHGHHHMETMEAVLRFPRTPALFTCHGWAPWQERPPLFPSIRRYIAVDDLCRERLLTTVGLDPALVETFYNFVDLERFHRRGTLPDRPARALILSNHSTRDDLRVAAIIEGCSRYGIEEVDIVGRKQGNPTSTPERLLGHHHVVFAKARAALEAMASGCAVIVSDTAGLGGYVSMDNVERLRRLNFGVRTLQTAATTADNVLCELQRFDARDAGRVTEYIRDTADMKKAVDRWEALYHELIKGFAGDRIPADHSEACLAAASDYLGQLSQGLKDLHRVVGLRPEELSSRLSGLQNEVSELGAGNARLSDSLDRATEALAAIHSSRGWRVLQRYWGLRRWLAGSGGK